ncbi:MAG TPA: DPP IV N-terminal domain-containing protein [Burkholderiales bacterium]|nr:DPP IV N-terminal domain-containing protein [Burkholderiales bacterium]
MRFRRPLAVLSLALVLPAAEAVAAEEPAAAAEGIEPEYVRPLVPVARGRNDSNPVWSLSGDTVAFERSRGDDKEIVIVRTSGEIVQTIHQQATPAPGQSTFFFPGVVEPTSYNSGITWSPDGKRLVFMSNGGEGNYDLYLRESDGRITRITTDREKDGHADWSPTADQIAFVSGRSGKGDVYLLDLTKKTTTRLTHGEQPYLYPQWSPDGKRLAFIQGSNENHDVAVLAPGLNPPARPKQLTTWRYDDLRPVWSPDGKRIAFYTNYNAAGDPKTWAIAVVAADGSDPAEGDGLAARIVATDVVPDVERGPAWLPDNRRIAYVRDEKQAYYPIYVADVESRASTLLRTGTKMNHDVNCSRGGLIAFRAQVDQWDQVYVAKLKDPKP